MFLSKYTKSVFTILWLLCTICIYRYCPPVYDASQLSAQKLPCFLYNLSHPSCRRDNCTLYRTCYKFYSVSRGNGKTKLYKKIQKEDQEGGCVQFAVYHPDHRTHELVKKKKQKPKASKEGRSFGFSDERASACVWTRRKPCI